MNRLRSLATILAVLLAVAAASALALDVPPAPTQWLTDRAGILSASDAESLNQKLRAFEERSGNQFLVYVFPALDDEALEDFTIRCAEKWKVGQKKYDNGLILFVFVQEKKLRVEVGYGLEGIITDAFSSDVIRNAIAPHFQRGDYAGGLNAGADQLIARIEGKQLPGESAPQPVSGVAQFQRNDFVMFIIILFIIFFFVLPLLRRGGCGCGGCFPMFPMGGGGVTWGGGGGGFSGGGFGGGGGFSGGGGGFGGGGASGGW